MAVGALYTESGKAGMHALHLDVDQEGFFYSKSDDNSRIKINETGTYRVCIFNKKSG